MNFLEVFERVSGMGKVNYLEEAGENNELIPRRSMRAMHIFLFGAAQFGIEILLVLIVSYR